MIGPASANGGINASVLQSGSQLRSLGSVELAQVGEDGLRQHLIDTAILAHGVYAPMEGGGLDEFLADRNLVRYPVELVFEVGTMAPHQFAHPEPDGDGFKLQVHPQLKHCPADLCLAVAYFLPVINYGSIINDDHCLVYGATLAGMTIDDYYQELCRIADSLGAPARSRAAKGDRF